MATASRDSVMVWRMGTTFARTTHNLSGACRCAEAVTRQHGTCASWKRVAVSCLMLLTLGGCEANRWESAYQGRAAPVVMQDHDSAAAAVRVRYVPWERIAATQQRLEAEVAASDVHPDDWGTEKREAAKAELLKGLQVSESAASVDVLGRSEFRTTDTVRVEGGELAAFAAKIGASRVVYSSTLLGKADRIVYEPVTTWTQGSDWYRNSRRRGNAGYSEHSTSWVPVRVQADETAWVAYFLRDLSR